MEIVSINQADQFLPGRSAYECGFYAVAMVSSMAPVGKPPTKTPGQLSDGAQAWYAQYHGGDNSSSNRMGMTLDQLYALLKQEHLSYIPLPLDVNSVRAEIKAGHPVIVAGMETGFSDIGLGNKVPYPWTPSGSHVIVVTGLDGNNFLVRDSANIAPPNSLRPGPRSYDSSRMQIISATAVIPPWMVQASPAQPSILVPEGWHDDGKTLTAPNGHRVVNGFRAYILDPKNHWDKGDMPLEEERSMPRLELSNPTLGGGSQQCFVVSVLEWTPAKGVFKQWSGQELHAIRALLAQMS